MFINNCLILTCIWYTYLCWVRFEFAFVCGVFYVVVVLYLVWFGLGFFGFVLFAFLCSFLFFVFSWVLFLLLLFLFGFYFCKAYFAYFKVRKYTMQNLFIIYLTE